MATGGVQGRVAPSVTVRFNEVVRMPGAPLPLIATVAVPRVAVADALRINVLVVLVEAGLKVAVTPAGNPVAVNATTGSPFRLVTLTVLAVLEPRRRVTEGGSIVSLKSGVSTTTIVKLSVTLRLSVPLVPVTTTLP